jgi:hypothetical protein
MVSLPRGRWVWFTVSRDVLAYTGVFRMQGPRAARIADDKKRRGRDVG